MSETSEMSYVKVGFTQEQHKEHIETDSGGEFVGEHAIVCVSETSFVREWTLRE